MGCGGLGAERRPQVSDYCGAKTRSGRPCRQKAMAGGKRCYVHGGKSPQALRASAARQVEQRARRLLADLGEVEPLGDPITALEDLAAQMVALTNLLRDCVTELEQVRYRAEGMGTEQLRAEITAYLAAAARAESVLHKIVSLDIDERRLRLDEAKAAVVVAALADVLAHRDLGLDAERQRQARALLAAKLGVPAPARIDSESQVVS